MEFIDPIEGAGNEERAHFGLAVVKGQGAPFGIFGAQGIRRFIKGGAVEMGEGKFILGEMGGDPVEDDADAGFVQGVDKITEIIGIAVAAGRREKAGDLIAPGAVERMLADADELHMGIAHPVGVLGQLIGKVAVV